MFFIFTIINFLCNVVFHIKHGAVITKKAITLIKNDDNTLPLSLDEGERAAFFYPLESAQNSFVYAFNQLKEEGIIPTDAQADYNCFTDQTADNFAETVANAKAVVISVETASERYLDPTKDTTISKRSKFVDDMIALAHNQGKKVILLSMNLPYDVARYTDADAILAGYGNKKMPTIPEEYNGELDAYGPNYPAAIMTAFGENAPDGHLPVDVYTVDKNYQFTDEILYPVGYGLNYAGATDADTEKVLLKANIEGMGQMAVSDDGTEPVFNTEYPVQTIAYSVAKGDTIILSAKADEGYQFAGWKNADTDELYSTDATITVEMTEALNLKAVFEMAGSTGELPQDVKDYFAKTFGYFAQKDYEAKNGTAPANTSCEFSDDNANAIITLTDKDDNVLDVYTVSVETGVGTNQDGEEVDLSTYAKEPEYFMPYHYIGDVAEIYYFEQTGTRAGGRGMLTDVVDNTVQINVYDNNGDTLETYTVNAETGIGTDSKGNDVDFSVYADYQPLEESDFFMSTSAMIDTARDYYKETTGTAAEGSATITEKPNFNHEVEITLCAEDETVLEVYTIVAETGIGTDSKGNAVNFAEYAAEKELEKYYNSVAKALNFYAEQEYEAKNGTAPANVSCEFSDDRANAVVTLTDENDNVLDVYTVNVSTGIGTNQKGDAVDLSAYAKEPEYFMPYDYIGDVAQIYYSEQTGIPASSRGILTDVVDNTVEITIYDDKGGTLEVYTINAETGIGTDRFGDEVDFSVYADYKPLEDSDYFISKDTVLDVASAYYEEVTGTKPEGSVGASEKKSFQHELEIAFCAEDGTVLETYTINPTTGIGTDSNGNAVDLAEFAKTHDIQDEEPTSEVDTRFFGTPEEIADMAVIDYQKKTGIDCHWTNILVDDDTNTVTVTLADDNGNIITTYIIDRVTGMGKTADGKEVNLPQTGNNSMTNLLTALGAFLMIGFGGITMRLSGFFRKKDEQ
ncbi:MAG: glycoside hydrolase family 3 C-terminal domain-containing protein [Oscillospiraceae bacterium]